MCGHGSHLLGVECVLGGAGDDNPTGTTGYAVGRTRGMVENNDVQVLVNVSDQGELNALPDTSGSGSTPGAGEALRSQARTTRDSRRPAVLTTAPPGVEC